MSYLEELNKVIEAMGKVELDQNAQQTTSWVNYNAISNNE